MSQGQGHVGRAGMGHGGWRPPLSVCRRPRRWRAWTGVVGYWRRTQACPARSETRSLDQHLGGLPGFRLTGHLGGNPGRSAHAEFRSLNPAVRNWPSDSPRAPDPPDAVDTQIGISRTCGRPPLGPGVGECLASGASGIPGPTGQAFCVTPGTQGGHHLRRGAAVLRVGGGRLPAPTRGAHPSSGGHTPRIKGVAVGGPPQV